MSETEQTLNQALGYHRAGAFQEAQRLYRLVLQTEPRHGDVNHNLGVLLVQIGQPQTALPYLKLAVEANPAQGQYWLSYAEGLLALGHARDALGVIDDGKRGGLQGAAVDALRQRIADRLGPGPGQGDLNHLASLVSTNQYAEAEAVARQMIQRWPHHGIGWKALGTVLTARQRAAEALPVLKKSLALLPSDPETYNTLGLTLHALGHPSEAEASYRQALTLKPDYWEAHCNLGNTLKALGRLSEAEASYRRALALKPDYPEAHNNLGTALQELGRSTEAEASYRRALALKPDYYQAHNNLGVALQELGRLSEAEASCRRALALMPDYPEAHSNLGNALKAMGRLSEAEASYRRALTLKPDFYHAHNNLGHVLRALGRLSEAEASYRRALTLKPDLHLAHNNLGNALKAMGRSTEAEASYRRALELKPDFHEAYSNLLFMLNYDPDRSAEEIYSAYRQFDTHFGQPLRSEWRSHGNDCLPSRPLRVGYVSPDFRKHSCRHFIEPLLFHHDKSAVEVFAYADVLVEDDVTARMKSHVDHWVRTVAMDDAQMADRIRTDAIDILVDLAGHTAGNRLLVFARKPAPVSVTMLGFGYTTGLSAIDWYLTDLLVVPEESEHLFSERPWRISQCLVYRPAEGMGNVSVLPALTQGCVTFGTLTRALRINHRTIRAWSEVLRRVPGSRLLLDSRDFRDVGLCQALIDQFAAHGIGRERLEMGFHSPPWDVLRKIDISLDCFPHNSGTTLFESLYMGVPFITLAGRPSVGRLGASIVANAGHPEWIAASEEQYVDKVVTLAADLPRLAEVRARLRAEMQASPLMAEAGYARNVEVAYREMWRRWCADASANACNVVTDHEVRQSDLSE